MAYVNIKVTREGGSDGTGPTAQEKSQLIEGVTDLLHRDKTQANRPARRSARQSCGGRQRFNRGDNSGRPFRSDRCFTEL